MAVVGELIVAILGTNVGLTSALARSEAELKGFSATAAGQGGVVGTALRGIGVVGAAVFAGSAGIGILSLRAGIQFQEAMTGIAVNAHLTEDAANHLAAAIESAAIGTTSTALEMAQAFDPVAGELQRLSGHALTSADALNLLRAAEALHVAAGSSLAASTKSIADILLTYHLRATDAANVSTLLYSAKAQLGVGVDFLSGALQKLQPRIAGSGVDLQTMLAIAREMEPSVGTGQRAILKLGAVLQSFLSPSSAAQKALDSIGVSLTDAQGKFVGFPTAIEDLHNALANVTPVQRAADLYAIFGKNANLAGVLVAGGAAGLSANAAALTAQGSAAAAAAEKNKDLANQGEILRKDLDDAATVIGTALVPAFNSALRTVLPVINAFAQWTTANPQLAANILLVAGAIGVAIPVLLAVWAIVGALSLPVLAVTAVIVALGLAWANNWLNIRGVVSAAAGFIGTVIRTIVTVVSSVATSIGLLWGSLTQIFNSVAKSISDAIGVAAGVIRSLVGIVATVAAALASFFDWLTGKSATAKAQVTGLAPGSPGTPQGGTRPGTGVGAGTSGLFGVGATPLVTAASLAASGLVAGPFQYGGVVPGIGPMLAIVHGGETVLPVGGNASPISSVRHIHIEVGGRELFEYLDREFFNTASGFSSGFQAGNPVTGA